MHGLILAGGEGSRLAADGVSTPKALAEVAGRPQLVALAERLAILGGAPTTCLVRDDALARIPPDVARRLAACARLVPCRTPTSLHTLVAGFAELPPGPVFCTMVDTVMRDDDWHAVHAAAGRALAAGADAVLVVTPPAEDDAPLWVQLGADDTVARIGGGPSTPPRVTGGVYAFAPTSRERAREALAAGRQRMRGFLADLAEHGADVRAVHVARMVDIDRARDLVAADALLAGRAVPLAGLDTAPDGILSPPPRCR